MRQHGVLYCRERWLGARVVASGLTGTGTGCPRCLTGDGLRHRQYYITPLVGQAVIDGLSRVFLVLHQK